MMRMSTITELACHYAEDLSRIHNYQYGTCYPPCLNLDSARKRLALLCERVGEENFKAIVTRWEQELVLGIDV